MINSLKELSKGLGKELSRAWESLADGWRELLSRSNNALTHFVRGSDPDQSAGGKAVQFPNWGLLASEVVETATEVVVRLELPGVEKEDCQLSIEGHNLVVRGEKHYDREHVGSSYHVMERAYGSFVRLIPLPTSVDESAAKASFRSGVLQVSLPKIAHKSEGRSISIA